MKALSIFLSLIGAIANLHSQKKINEFRLECYRPIVTNGMSFYYNDEWATYPLESDGSVYNRNYRNIGFSATYIRHFEKFNAGVRVGTVSRNLIETSVYKYADDQLNDRYTFNQEHLLGSIFIQRNESIKFLDLKLGLEIPYIHYGKGHTDFTRNIVNYENGNVWSTTDLNWTFVSGTGFATGLGINLGIAYKMSRKMSLGIELNKYLLYTEFSRPYSRHQYLKYKWTTPESEDIKEYHYTGTSTFKQTTFSLLIPRLFYSFHF